MTEREKRSELENNLLEENEEFCHPDDIPILILAGLVTGTVGGVIGFSAGAIADYLTDGSSDYTTKGAILGAIIPPYILSMLYFMRV